MPYHDPNKVPRLVARISDATKPYAKAFVAGASVAIAVAIPLTNDGITSGEALTVAGAFLAGAFPTWAVPNLDPKAQHQDESVQPPEAGADR